MVLTRPAAMFVTNVTPGPEGVDIQGGAVLHLGDDAKTTREVLVSLQKDMLGDDVKSVKIEDSTYYQIQPGPGMPLITWGIRNKYLVVGFGAGAVEKIIEREKPDELLPTVRGRVVDSAGRPVDRVELGVSVQTFVSADGPGRSWRAACIARSRGRSSCATTSPSFRLTASTGSSPPPASRSSSGDG